MVKVNFWYISYFRISQLRVKKKSIIYAKNICYFLSFFYILLNFKNIKVKIYAKPKVIKLLSLITTPQTSKRKAFQFYQIKYKYLISLEYSCSSVIIVNYLYFYFFIKRLSFLFSSILTFNTKFNLVGSVRLNYIKYVIILIIFFSTFFYFHGYFFLGILHNFLIFLFMFLQIVFFTTCERKILALTQRRVGPRVIGARGRLQFFADAVKLLTKTNASPKKVNMLFFQACAIGAYWLSWLNFSNLFFNYGEDIIDIEYNIFFAIAVSLVFSIAWIVAGWSSVSKYAMLGCLRACVQSISYEILMSAVLLNIILFAGVINFELIVTQQETISFIFFFPYLAVIGFLATLMESNKPPFDLSEAESDIVAGYTVEYAGILFGLFMLAEYLNLFTNAIVLVILFLGSWWTISHYLVNFVYTLKCIALNLSTYPTHSISLRYLLPLNDNFVFKMTYFYDSLPLLKMWWCT